MNLDCSDQALPILLAFILKTNSRALIAADSLCRADSTQQFPGCSARSLRCSAWVGNCNMRRMPGGPAESVSNSGAAGDNNNIRAWNGSASL